MCLVMVQVATGLGFSFAPEKWQTDAYTSDGIALLPKIEHTYQWFSARQQ